MPIVDAVKACFAKYTDFNGRATRSEYWWFCLAVLLGSAVTLTIAGRLYVLFSLVTLLPMIAVGARRLHDTNRSGWWQLLAAGSFRGHSRRYLLDTTEHAHANPSGTGCKFATLRLPVPTRPAPAGGRSSNFPANHLFLMNHNHFAPDKTC